MEPVHLKLWIMVCTVQKSKKRYRKYKKRVGSGREENYYTRLSQKVKAKVAKYASKSANKHERLKEGL